MPGLVSLLRTHAQHMLSSILLYIPLLSSFNCKCNPNFLHLVCPCVCHKQTQYLLYCTTVTNYLRCPCLAFLPLHHNNPTFASRWQVVFYAGSASRVVLSDRVSVSLRSSMRIKIDMAFLVSRGWSIPYVSSALLLPDFLHSFFTSVCFSVNRQGALHVVKGIPQLVIPSSQGWGVRSFHLDSTRFFFLAPFCLFLHEPKKRTRPASSHGHVEFLHV